MFRTSASGRYSGTFVSVEFICYLSRLLLTGAKLINFPKKSKKHPAIVELSRTTTTEEGVNNYTILLSILNAPQLRTRKKLLSKQPSQITRLEFVNNIFDGYHGWEVLIDLKCRKLIEDLINQRKEMDGSKSKVKIMDSKFGIKYEKYGHFSDTLDYLLVLFLNEPWKKFNASGTSGITTFNGTPIYGSFDY